VRLTEARLKTYRDQTYCRTARGRVRQIEGALDFVNARGFVYFWPIKGVEMPSLWSAVAGNRPVAEQHDDPGHVTWGWKDQWLGEKKWYYAKVLRGKATLIALSALPYFYALSENFGDADDYRLQYEAGQLTVEAKQVYEALLEKGKLDTISLRREARLTGTEHNTRFERALVELQRDFKILPVAVAQAGAWKYAFVYELVSRWFPELPTQARDISRGEARAYLVDRFLESVGAAPEAQLGRLFGWRTDEVRRVCEKLAAQGQIRQGELGRAAPEPVWVTQAWR
jgi:hypothetical protein